MFSKHNFKKLLKKYYPLLAILIGVTFISIAMGSYLTLDTDLEFSTAQGILKWGIHTSTLGVTSSMSHL